MITYILTKIGVDWLISVDATVLNRKLWMDRRRTAVRTDTDGQWVITIAHWALRAQVS